VRFGHNEELSVPGNVRVAAADDVAALDILVEAGDRITINTATRATWSVAAADSSDERMQVLPPRSI
jgi:uncharacterized cupin superfamily protein